MEHVFSFHPSETIRQLILICFLLTTLLSLLGAFYEWYSNKLHARNLRHHPNILTLFLTFLTSRYQLEKAFEHQQFIQMLTAEELEIFLNTHLIRQPEIAHSMAHYLHYFLNLNHQSNPMNIFLFKGEKENGKTYLAKIIAQKLRYSFILIEENAPLNHLSSLETLSEKHVIVIKQLSSLSLEAQHLLLKITQKYFKNIFIFTETISKEDFSKKISSSILLKKIHRELLFNPLDDVSLTKIIAHNLEEKIQNAGFQLPNNLFPPAIIQHLLTQNAQEIGDSSLKQKITFIENIILPHVNHAQQRGENHISFSLEGSHIKINSYKERDRL